MRMQQRSYQPGVWERLGVDGRKMFDLMQNNPTPEEVMFQQMLFSKIVPNLKKLGLLTPKVRQAFTDLDIIKFEDFDPEAQDRQLGFL